MTRFDPGATVTSGSPPFSFAGRGERRRGGTRALDVQLLLPRVDGPRLGAVVGDDHPQVQRGRGLAGTLRGRQLLLAAARQAARARPAAVVTSSVRRSPTHPSGSRPPAASRPR